MLIQFPFRSGKSSQPAPPTIGDDLQLYVDSLHSPFNAAVARGNTYIYSTLPAGIALLVPATTGNHPTLWNPAGSGVNLNVLGLFLSYASGTDAPTALEWAGTTKAGNQAATGSPILTFTNVAPVNALFGGPVNNKAQWAPAVNTYSAAPVGFAALGVGLHTNTAAGVTPPDVLFIPYSGMLGVAPGNAISLCSVAATTTALFMVSLVVEEVPILGFQQNP